MTCTTAARFRSPWASMGSRRPTCKSRGAAPSGAGLAALLALAAACAPPSVLHLAKRSSVDPLLGRWHRLDTGQPGFVADPLGSLAQADIELRDEGLLVDLLVDSGSAFSTVTGGYARVDAEHIRAAGRCWQGYDSRPCSQTYRYTLSGDRLTLFGDGQTVAGLVADGQLAYQRVGPAGAALPPTLVPPGPSPTP